MERPKAISFIGDRLIAYLTLLFAMIGTINVAEGEIGLATEAYLASIATALLYVSSRMLQVQSKLNENQNIPQSRIIDDILRAAPPAIMLGLGRLLYLSSQSQNKEQFTILLGVSGVVALYSIANDLRSVRA